MLVGVILGRPHRQPRPLRKGYGSVEHQRRRCEAVIERGQIDERLDRGTGLPLSLSRPVELTDLEAEPAADRKDAPRVRIHGDKGAGYFGDLAQIESIRRLGLCW